MKSLRRLWHAAFGHKHIVADLTQQPWTATCSCGFSFHVREFTLGKIGSDPD